MFFILSKILIVLLSPLLWVLGMWGLARLAKQRKLKKRLNLAAIALLLFFSNGFIFEEFMRLWEIRATPDTQLAHYDYGIVLGGMASYDEEFERVNFSRSTDRLLQALRLYKTGKIDKIFISGGSGIPSLQHQKESEYLRNYLLEIGFSPENIEIENRSRNTRENAVFSAEILSPKSSDNNFLLISSALHLRRAGGCFRKAGFEVELYATDRYAGGRRFSISHLLLPKPEILAHWQRLIHEWAGFAVYRIMGYL